MTHTHKEKREREGVSQEITRQTKEQRKNRCVDIFTIFKDQGHPITISELGLKGCV